MATKIRVVPRELRDAAKGIKRHAEEYQREFIGLFKDVHHMGSAWAGEDTQAYQEQLEGFRDDFQKMYSNMLKYANYLETTADRYDKTQDDLAREARKLSKDA